MLAGKRSRPIGSVSVGARRLCGGLLRHNRGALGRSQRGALRLGGRGSAVSGGRAVDDGLLEFGDLGAAAESSGPRLSYRSVANENGIYCRSQESLDEPGRAGVSADEIAERAKDGSLAKNRAFLQQSRRRGRQADALSLQAFERVELGA